MATQTQTGQLGAFVVTTEWQGDRYLKKWDAELGKRIKTGTTELHREVLSSMGHPSRDQGPAPVGQPAGSSTGQRRRNVVMDFPDQHTGRVGFRSGFPYGMIHELGGVIRPKRKRALVVPVSREAKKWMQSGASALDFTPPRGRSLAKIRRPGKPPLLVERIGGRNARSIIHFILVDSVRIPARPVLVPTLQRMIPRLKQIMLAPFPE